MKRTRLELKYQAVKKLEQSQRTHGLEFVPKFREVAREMELPPQLLVELWRRRLLIIERAKRKLPEETLKKIDKETFEMPYFTVGLGWAKDIPKVLERYRRGVITN